MPSASTSKSQASCTKEITDSWAEAVTFCLKLSKQKKLLYDWEPMWNIMSITKLCNDVIFDLWPSSPCFPSNGHNQKVHMHMVDLMSSIICEGDTVSQELLDTVLVNLVPAHKVSDWNVIVTKHI